MTSAFVRFHAVLALCLRCRSDRRHGEARGLVTGADGATIRSCLAYARTCSGLSRPHVAEDDLRGRQRVTKCDGVAWLREYGVYRRLVHASCRQIGFDNEQPPLLMHPLDDFKPGQQPFLRSGCNGPAAAGISPSNSQLARQGSMETVARICSATSRFPTSLMWTLSVKTGWANSSNAPDKS